MMSDPIGDIRQKSQWPEVNYVSGPEVGEVKGGLFIE